jgi:phage shock protein B
MLEDLWRSSKTMERRIEALESILDAEAPGWRKRHGEEDV